jgi:signal transduction histidine kinase
VTRRITLAILLTCWLVLLAGGSIAYVAIRGAILKELDASLVLRASSLPEVLGVAHGTEQTLPAGDRYIIKNALGQTLARPGTQPSMLRPVEVRGKRFATLADGMRVRSVTLVVPEFAGVGEMTVVYSSSAERYDRLIARLSFIFITVGIAAGLLTAGAARVVARSALRPLTAAVSTVTSIDDNSLDRRVDVGPLPIELRPMAEHLNQMLSRLEQGLQQRKQFMADAAHELRTPVAALLTSMEVALRRPRDATALTEVVRECVGDVRVLRRLVEGLLEQFRADAGKSAAAVQLIDVSAVLDLCVDSVRTSARQKNVTIEAKYASDLQFVTRPQQLRSIVSNLLGNALEYNIPAGSVQLSCSIDDRALTITVRDTGKGIAADLLPHVFEPFSRGSDGVNSEAGHCGLGLYLVKSHAEALGGTCIVRSMEGNGSEFQIRLPRLPAAGTSPMHPDMAAAAQVEQS